MGIIMRFHIVDMGGDRVASFIWKHDRDASLPVVEAEYQGEPFYPSNDPIEGGECPGCGSHPTAPGLDTCVDCSH